MKIIVILYNLLRIICTIQQDARVASRKLTHLRTSCQDLCKMTYEMSSTTPPTWHGSGVSTFTITRLRFCFWR